MEQGSRSKNEQQVDTSLKLGLPEFRKETKILKPTPEPEPEPEPNPKPKPQAFPGRVCEECGGTETPTWRRGPSGPNTLCNRCGLRYAREQKKAKNAEA